MSLLLIRPSAAFSFSLNSHSRAVLFVSMNRFTLNICAAKSNQIAIIFTDLQKKKKVVSQGGANTWAGKVWTLFPGRGIDAPYDITKPAGGVRHYRHRTSIKGIFFFLHRPGLFPTKKRQILTWLEREKAVSMRLRSSRLWRGGEPQMLLFREALSLKMTNNSATKTPRAVSAAAASSVSAPSDGDVKQYVLYHKAGAN